MLCDKTKPNNALRISCVFSVQYSAFFVFDFSCVCFYALCFSLLLIGEYIKKSFMLCRLAQERMTLSDLKWPFYASLAFSAVAELLVLRSESTESVNASNV